MAIYFGEREVKEFVIPKVADENGNEIDHDEVLVTYAEGLPTHEAVPIGEWEAGKTDKPVEKNDRNLWFVARTSKLRSDIHKVFEKHNPRFAEIGRVLGWVQEAYGNAFKRAVELKTGIESFEINGSFGVLKKAHEENGSKMLDDMPEIQKDILEVLIKHNVNIGNVMFGGFFQQTQKSLEDFLNKGFSYIVGSDDEHRRCNDLEDIFIVYDKKTGTVGETVEGDKPSDGKDNVSRKDEGGGVEQAVEASKQT